MSESRITEILEKYKSGSEFLLCDYDTDVDIAVPKQYSITTLAKKATLTIRIKYNALATVVLNTGLVIGTGGSAYVGAALPFSKRDEANTSAPLTELKVDYLLGSSGQAAGTMIYQELQLPNMETVIKKRLKASTKYGLVITTIADNNYGSVIFELDED